MIQCGATDPLMFTIMEDPVILPSSQMTIDRATIISVLLSDAHDPFNRAPLSLDMVVPSNYLMVTHFILDFELKGKIEAWKTKGSQKP